MQGGESAALHTYLGQSAMLQPLLQPAMPQSFYSAVAAAAATASRQVQMTFDQQQQHIPDGLSSALPPSIIMPAEVHLLP